MFRLLLSHHQEKRDRAQIVKVASRELTAAVNSVCVCYGYEDTRALLMDADPQVESERQRWWWWWWSWWGKKERKINPSLLFGRGQMEINGRTREHRVRRLCLSRSVVHWSGGKREEKESRSEQRGEEMKEEPRPIDINWPNGRRHTSPLDRKKCWCRDGLWPGCLSV